MGGFLNSLSVVAESMRAVQHAIDITGNNVVNAKSPGFTKQKLTLEAQHMDINGGLSGGVRAGDLVSGRNEYLERSVQASAQQSGRYSQQTQALQQIEPIFDISSTTGLGSAIDKMFQGFSQWSVNPNDQGLRQDVLERARDLSSSFQYTSSQLGGAAATLDIRLGSIVDNINRLGAQVQDYNRQIKSNSAGLQDPGLDAQIHNTLEQLSEYADFGVLKNGDGSLTINLGGQTPLVMGESIYPLSLDASSSARARVLNSAGAEVSDNFQAGQIRGVLDVRNKTIPELRGRLDTLASTIASRVNTVLSQGVDRNGDTPSVGLFSFDPNQPARSLKVTDILPEELAGASASAPGGNGNALDLAALGSSRELGDFSFSQYFGDMAGGVGRALSNAQEQQHTQDLVLSQARQLRSDVSDVSLDEEASNLIAFQRAYQANAELVKVLNGLTETTIGLLR